MPARKNPQPTVPDEIESYLAQLEPKLRGYSPDQRAEIIAALAERHLARSEAEPDRPTTILREALEAAWSHVQGQRLPPADLERLRSQVAASQPAESTARALVDLALQGCLAEDNLPLVLQALRLDCEAALTPPPGYPQDPAARRLAWRQPQVASTVQRQRSLLLHASHPIVNQHIVDFLKRDARSDTPFQVGGTVFTIPTRPASSTRSRSAGSESARGRFTLPFPQPGEIDESLPNSGILKQLASMLGRLQQGISPEELLKKVGETTPVTSQAEQAQARLLESTMSSWTNLQRTAFVAVLGKRWIEQYESFSASEDWGDPALLRRSLEAAWDHLRGQKLSRSRASRLSEQILENTPDTEDFDAPLAMAACEILDRLLDCCLEADNLDSAVSAAMAACSSQAMLGQGRDYRGEDPAEEERLWQQPLVREEIEFQVKLLERIGAMKKMDDEEVEILSMIA